MDTKDSFLQEVIARILQELKETEAHLKKAYGCVPSLEEQEVTEDVIATREVLAQVQPLIKSVEDVENQDEEMQEFLFECLAEYSANAIVDERDEKLKAAQEKELEVLDEILDRLQSNLPVFQDLFEEDQN